MERQTKNSNSFLKSLVEEILVDYQVNKYQVNYMLKCLVELKPQYQILRYFKKEQIPSAIQFFWNPNIIKADMYIEFEVFDSIQKINKYLQIFLLNTYTQSKLSSLKNLVERVRSFGNLNLVLTPLDSYILDSDEEDSSSSSLSDNDLFVVEFEMFNMTLKEYCSTFNIKEDQISQLIQKQVQYCEQISLIKVSSEANRTNSKQSLDHLFIKIEPNGQVRLKVNLVTTDNFYTMKDPFRKEQTYQQYQQQLKHENKEINKYQSSNDDKKIKYLEVLSHQLKNNTFKEHLKEIEQIMSRDDLLQKLVQLNPKVFELHDQSIFNELIECQKYQDFEIIDLDNQRFLFKTSQLDGNVCYLEGKKCHSLESAQQLHLQYQNLIEASLLNQNFITLISSSELRATEKEYYLLIERKARISLIENQQQSFLSFSKNQFQDTNKNCEKIQQQLFIQFLSEFAQLCQFLFVHHSIPITCVNPHQILVQQQHLNLEGKTNLSLQIEDFNQGDFSEEYIESISSMLSGFDIIKNITSHVQQLFKTFIQTISSKQMDKFMQIYPQIQTFISSTNKVVELQHQIENQCSSFKVLLQTAGTFFEKINVNIDIYKLNAFEINSVTSLLNSHSLNHIECNVGSILKFNFDLSVTNRKLFLVQEQEAIMNKFFSVQDENRSEQDLLKKQINIFLNSFLVNVDISIEQNSYKFDDTAYNISSLEKIKLTEIEQEKFSSSEYCLKLNFYDPKNSQQKTVIKLILAENKIAIIVCETPLKIIYFNSMNINSIKECLAQADWNQCLQTLLPTRNEIIPELSSNDLSFLQLAIVSNLKDVKELQLHLDPSNYQNFKQYSALLVKHTSLQSVNIMLNFKVYGKQNIKTNIMAIFCNLKELISQMKSGNTLQLGIDCYQAQKHLIQKSLFQLRKSSRLVCFIITYKDNVQNNQTNLPISFFQPQIN